MDIIGLATKIFMDKVGGMSGSDNITSAFSSLLSDADGNIDIMGLVSKFQSGDVSSLLGSWLGNDANSPISSDQISNIFGSEKVSEFASKAGLDVNTALSGLSETIPSLIDQVSDGSSLLDNIGGVDGLASLGKSLFK